MTREEYRKKLSRIIGDESKVIELMIDLDNVINHARPPAEGAENCWNCGIDLRNAPDGVTKHHCICGATDPGERQQQPTAEGAEEIGVYDIANKWAVWVKGNEVAARDSMVADIYGLLNVHAQKIADKMVSERLRDEKAFTDWCINHVEIESREEKYIIDNETTIYSFSDLMDYWNRYLK